MEQILLLLILAGVVYLGILQYFTNKSFKKMNTDVQKQLDAMNAKMGDIVAAEASEDAKLSEILAAEQDEDTALGTLGDYIKQIIANEGSGADQADTIKALTDFNTQLDAVRAKAAQRTADLQPIVDKAKDQTAALKALQVPVVAPPVTADKSYVAQTGEIIVVSEAGDLPVAGEATTVNGAPLTVGASYTLVDGAVLVIGDDSKVVSYSAAQA